MVIHMTFFIIGSLYKINVSKNPFEIENMDFKIFMSLVRESLC